MSYNPNRSIVTLADGAQQDPFGRLRTSNANTVFDSQQEYGLNTLTTWDATANGVIAERRMDGSVVSGSNSVGPTNLDTRMTPLTVSTTSGHYSVLQSRSYTRYIPGKGQLVLMTGIFSPGVIANCDARSGYFDSANGIFLKVTNGVAGVVRRTSTAGSVVDNEVLQSSWNVDKLDGTGASGITLDLTKTQILVIDAQWLGVGRVRVGFDIDGMVIVCHEFLNANSLTVPYTQTFNLPVRMELRNSGTSSGTPTIQFVCCSVQSEGGQDIRGFPRCAPPSITSIAVTARRPVMSIRPKLLLNGRINRSHVENVEFMMRTTTNDNLYEIVIGGTLTGAAFRAVGNVITAGAFVVGNSYTILTIGTTDFTLIGASANTVGVVFTAAGVGVGTGTAVENTSAVEYDSSATAIVGGITILQGWSISGAGTNALSTIVGPDIRNPLTLSQIDGLTPLQPNLTLVCTSVNATSNVQPSANWHEQIL